MFALEDSVGFKPFRSQFGFELLKGGRRRNLIAHQLQQSGDERISQVTEGRRRCAGNFDRGWWLKVLALASLAHRSARRCSAHSQTIFSARRLRFSMRTRRSIVGKAQSSPIESEATSWKAL